METKTICKRINDGMHWLLYLLKCWLEQNDPLSIVDMVNSTMQDIP